MGYGERGEEAIERAAELEPGNANIRGWQSVLLARRGAREDAVRAALEQARLSGKPWIVYGGDSTERRSNCTLLPWHRASRITAS